MAKKVEKNNNSNEPGCLTIQAHFGIIQKL